MNTIHDLVRESTSDQERELAGLGRPSLHGRARRARTVRHARVAAGATVGVGALAVGAALVVPAMWPQNTTAIAFLTPAGGSSLPLAADGSLLSVIPTGNVVVDIYLDAMCPVCKEFSTRYEADLRAIDGATVVYHPVSILDRASSDGSYSTRAASAIQEVAAGAPDRLGAFLNHLWANQPVEGAGTLTDDQLVELATAAGVPADVSGLFAQHRYADAVAKATQAASDAGLQGVPTVYIDGTMFDPTSGSGYDDLVDQVRAAILARQLIDAPQTPGSSDVPATASATAPPSAGALASAYAPTSDGSIASQSP
jgi:protein-disulfide isomerase